MAKKAAEPEHEPEEEHVESAETIAAESLPEGFDPVGVVGPQAWAVKSPGNIVRGILCGLFEKKGKGKGAAYQVKLTQPAKVIKQKEITVAAPGDMVCVDATKALDGFRSIVNDGGKYEIFVKYVELRTLDDGNTFWVILPGRKMISPPPERPKGDTIPF
jgi:hypothetical protein